jgi:hypothetical protein
MLPTAVYGLIRKYRQDYLYGNIMADTILAKKYMPASRNSHNWDVAVELLESARKKSEKAFSLGYMSHLAADTVAHGSYTAGFKNLRHTLLEFRADSAIDSAYWFKAIAIGRKVRSRNDDFLEKSLDSVIFSFKTNNRIFKGVVALSLFNQEVFSGFFDRNFNGSQRKDHIDGLQRESLDRIVDVLQNGVRSEVLKKDPIGKVRRSRVLKSFIG